MSERVTLESEVWGRLSVAWMTRIDANWVDNPDAVNIMPAEKGSPTFYELPQVYPVTIVQARYGGAYEGAEWLCFPCYPHQVDDKARGWDDSDIECAEFWEEVGRRPGKWIIGRGWSPDDAYKDLIDRIIKTSEKT